MKVVVEDANVLLDLVNGGVLAHWLGLDFENCTTPLVWREVSDGAQRSIVQPFIEAGLIRLVDIAPHQWQEIVAFKEQAGVSIADASVWLLAKSEGAVLLSGDSKLRKSARLIGVDVRGIFWVLDVLIERKKIKATAAAKALQRMLNQGAFLPQGECESRIASWTG